MGGIQSLLVAHSGLTEVLMQFDRIPMTKRTTTRAEDDRCQNQCARSRPASQSQRQRVRLVVLVVDESAISREWSVFARVEQLSIACFADQASAQIGCQKAVECEWTERRRS